MNDILLISRNEESLDQADHGPGGIWSSGEEVNARQAGVPGQNGHHTASGAEPSGIHADATGLVPQNGHHHLSCHRPLGKADKAVSVNTENTLQ